ncbi:MAG: hypothetical protein ACTHN5_20910 [Phycisphaerae bacterium]
MRRAVLWGMTLPWLFLPEYTYAWAGPLKWSKINAVSASLLFAVVLFDLNHLLRFRPRWFDLPAILIWVCPAFSAFANGLGFADAATSLVNSTLMYGVPYFLGRIYITDVAGLLELAHTLLLGGLLYVPLCLYEVRMSPILHYWIYGFFQHQWAQMVRDGGYRPIVFMQHGLAVAMWMSVATVVAFILWRLTSVRRVLGVPLMYWALALAGVELVCKSAGAIALTVAGCISVEICRRVSLRPILMILIGVAPFYVFARSSGILSANSVVTVLQVVFSPERISSVSDRLRQEDILLRHAIQSPILGWGPWGDFLFNPQGTTLVGHTDSMWMITLGKFGFLGLGAAMLTYLLPTTRIALRTPKKNALMPTEKLLQAFSLIPVMVMIDNLFNFMPNPLFVLTVGALASMSVWAPKAMDSQPEHTSLKQSKRNAVIGGSCALKPHHVPQPAPRTA